MFESLGDKLGKALDKLRGKGALTEEDVDAAAREIRIALLEADVALPVVKDFISRVRERAVGQEVIKSVSPAQQVVKIVNDALIEVLGSDRQDLQFASPPCAYLMVGLQGSGKTTSTAKISRWIQDRQGKKVLMASLDVYRPAAQEQLRQLGEQTGVATLPVIEEQKPVDIAKRAMDAARKEGYDLVMLDTAGRLSIDEHLMNEAAEIKNAVSPVESLLVADAMTGQDAVNTASAFDEKVGITGIMLTRVDGDARGGAALSMRHVTGKPVKLIGVGEKWDAIEAFDPERIAGRILGMGDIVSLVEKASETVDQEKAQELAKKFRKGKFDFNDLLTQLQQMKNMGGMGNLMKMMPGMGKMAGQLEEAGVDDSMLKRQEAIIYSMTKKERAKPELLNASRKKRIAAGSGTSVQDINRLVKQQQQMQTVMKRMRKMGMGKMMSMMKGMMGEQDAALLEQSMDPDALAKDMMGVQQGGGNPIGSNPFAGGGTLPDFGNPGGPGNFQMGGSATKNKGKSKRKKKKR
jgi:signal recognition particle subunit SRP54